MSKLPRLWKPQAPSLRQDILGPLICAMPFTETGGVLVRDISGYGNHGTLVTGIAAFPHWRSSIRGLRGQEVFFDTASGNISYIDMGSKDILNFERTRQFTIVMEIEFFNNATASVISNRDSVALRGWSFGRVSSKLRFTFTNTSVTNSLSIESTATVPDLTAMIVAMSYDGSSTPGGIKLYVNGLPVAMSTLTNTLSATTVSAHALQIGAESLTSPMPGAIWSLRIFPTVLSPSQVLADAQDPDKVWRPPQDLIYDELPPLGSIPANQYMMGAC